jgi:hypothetical protein
MAISRRGRIHDITIRLRRKDGRKVDAATARRALWAAHKIAQKGGSLKDEMREWVIEAIDWRKTPGKKYEYSGNNVTDVIANMGGILETVGMDNLRVEVAP